MIFLYSNLAGSKKIVLNKSDENFLYLTKVKRYKVKDTIFLGNLQDKKLYRYIFSHISKKEIFLEKTSQKENDNISQLFYKEKNRVYLAWGICDPKTIKKTLPFLNEIGVSQITFLECDRTQGNFVKEFLSEKFQKKIQKIIEQSCQQSGRLERMNIQFNHLKNFLHKKISQHKSSDMDFYICDFSNSKKYKTFPYNKKKKEILIGPEGGFSPNEKMLFQKKFPENIFQFSGNTIVRSETAVIGIAGKYLL